MSDFALSWSLSRQRLLDEVSNLTHAQLNWRLYAGSLSIGEMAVHVAGVEMLFSSQLMSTKIDGPANRILAAATDGVVNDLPFPFSPAEITPDFVRNSFDRSRALCELLIEKADPETRLKEIKSALGPIITGEGALARLGFHCAYHQGQAYMMKQAPGFPAA